MDLVAIQPPATLPTPAFPRKKVERPAGVPMGMQ